MSKHPRVGVGVLIFRGASVLVGKRCAHQHVYPMFEASLQSHALLEPEVRQIIVSVNAGLVLTAVALLLYLVDILSLAKPGRLAQGVRSLRRLGYTWRPCALRQLSTPSLGLTHIM